MPRNASLACSGLLAGGILVRYTHNNGVGIAFARPDPHYEVLTSGKYR